MRKKVHLRYLCGLNQSKKMHEFSRQRGNALLSAIETKSKLVLRQLSDQEREKRGYGRFLNNEKISVEDVLYEYVPEAPLSAQGQHVLLISDNTEVSFGLGGCKRGLKMVGRGYTKGFNLHPVIAMSASDGGCYGLAAAEVWERNYFVPTPPQQEELAALQKQVDLKKIEQKIHDKRLKNMQKQHERQSKFEDKDTHRWLRVALAAGEKYKESALRTVVSDSETDIYELYCALIVANLHFVIRAHQERCLENGTKLFAEMDTFAVQGSYFVKLPATDKRSAHTAELEVSWGKITILKSKQLKQYQKTNGTADLPDALELTVVRVRESAKTVVGKEAPIDWVLMTTHEVENWDQAIQIIQFYRWRWLIEQGFRTLKSEGLDIETCELREYEALAKFAILGLIAATNLLQLVQARDGKTNQKMQDSFDEIETQTIQELSKTLEGKTVKQQNPYSVESLAYAAWVIARLGGWMGYASERPPGPLTFRAGLIRFHNIVIGVKLVQKTQNPAPAT
jgi:Transposase DDE domain